MGKIINRETFLEEMDALVKYLVKRKLTINESKLILQRKIQSIDHDSMHKCMDDEFKKRKL